MTAWQDKSEAEENELSAGVVQVAFEKLFGGGRGVQKFARSGLRYVKLAGGATLVEQNPKKKSEWAELAAMGKRVAWVLRDGEYLARVIDGEVVWLD
ncbi:MAG: hypothetical protein H7Y30_03915 [Pyrinomonadaceae bacterium]|nr:hypothetical protein [Pyrinomonadaceae bacterium]